MVMALLRVKDLLHPCCENTQVLVTPPGSTKGVCQGMDPVPTRAGRVFVSGCMQSEWCEPGALPQPTVSLSTRQAQKQHLCIPAALSGQMGPRATQSQVKSTSLSSHPGTTLHTWTFSTSAAITTSSQNLCVPKNMMVAVKDTHRIRGRDKITNNSSTGNTLMTILRHR